MSGYGGGYGQQGYGQGQGYQQQVVCEGWGVGVWHVLQRRACRRVARHRITRPPIECFGAPSHCCDTISPTSLPLLTRLPGWPCGSRARDNNSGMGTLERSSSR